MSASQSNFTSLASRHRWLLAAIAICWPLSTTANAQLGAGRTTGGLGAGRSTSPAPAGPASNGQNLGGANLGGGNNNAMNRNPGNAGRASTSYYDDRSLPAIDPMLQRNPISTRNAARSTTVDVSGNDTENNGNVGGGGSGSSYRPPRGDGNRPRRGPWGYYNPGYVPFFYDYYSYNPYYYYNYGPSNVVTSVPLGGGNNGGFYQYQDSNNDGFYDRYSRFPDRDNDGVSDQVEEYVFENAVQQATDRLAAELEKDREKAALREDRKGKGVSISGGLSNTGDATPRPKRYSMQGTILDTKTAMVNDREHGVIQVRTNSGETIAVDVGPSNQPAVRELIQGLSVSVVGLMQPIGEQEILFADELLFRNQRIVVDRRNDPIQAVVLDFSRAPVRDAEHTMAVVDADGIRQLVDLGRSTPEEMELTIGAIVTVRGVPVRTKDYDVFVVDDLSVDGKPTPIVR